MNRSTWDTTNALRGTTQLLSLFLLAPLLAALSLAVADHIAHRPDYGFAVYRLEIVTVKDDGPAAAAGLRVGDRIQAVGGAPIRIMAEYYGALADDESSAPLELLLETPDGSRVVRITGVPSDQQSMIRDYCLWTIGMAFLAIGWWVLWRRDDPVTRSFFALCFIFAFFLMDVPNLANPVYMMAKELVRILLQLLLPAYFLSFFLRFPVSNSRRPLIAGSKQGRRLFLPAAVLFLITAAVLFWHPDPTGSRTETGLAYATILYSFAYYLTAIARFARRIRRRDRPMERTKMLVVLAGLLLGLVPFLATILLGQAVPARLAGPVQYLSLTVILVPGSFALAILRYGALDRTFIIRAGLVYGFLTLVLLAGYFAVVVGLGTFLESTFNVAPYTLLLVIVAAGGLAIQPLRGVVQGWIDRSFYPARQVHRRAMVDLADGLSGLVATAVVAVELVARLQELYRPQDLELFVSEGQDHPLVSVGASVTGTGPPHHDELAAESGLVRLLRNLRRPVFTEELEDLLLDTSSDPDSLQLLTRCNAQLVVPLVGGNRLVAFLAFGPKRGDVLYTQEDLANLRGLAVQAASILESRRFYQDSLQRQKLETEIEVARGIQASLLPVATLATPDFVIAGLHEPSLRVGGDFFDYFLREDGRLVFAIADVAGKGIPAALLMTSLCTGFRREAEARYGPAAIAERLNTSLSGRLAPGRFVCFFCAVWDPADGLLRYCNAGMEPPVLFRRDLAWRDRLRKGGPVLGAVDDHVYREGALTLQPGDRLFLHSDGLADQRNDAGEFYDEERLLAGVAAHITAHPPQLLDNIFAEVRQFGRGGEGDDMTAMMLEIKELNRTKCSGPLFA